MVRLLVLTLLLTPALCFAQTSGEVINGTLRVTQDAGTPTKVVGQNSAGDHHGLVVGSGLQLSNDTLSATGGGGGGIVVADITPDLLLGFNSSRDTITEVVVDYWESPGLPTTLYRDDVYLQNDTLLSKRGSHSEGYKSIAYSKSIPISTIDTLDNSSSSTDLDLTESGGRWTHTCTNAETVAPAGYDVVKLFRFNAAVSLSNSGVSTIESSLYIYLDGSVQNQCVSEFTLIPGSHKISVPISCLLAIDCLSTHTVDLRLGNDSGGTATYTIEQVNLNGFHFKTMLQEE